MGSLVTEFWCDIQTELNPRTGRHVWPIMFDPRAKSDPFIMPAAVTYGYLWNGIPRIRRTQTWFAFAPSTVSVFARGIHDPSSGPHISQSFFHDDQYGDLDGISREMVNIAEFMDYHQWQMTKPFAAHLAAWAAGMEITELPLDPPGSREEADALWLAVGEHFGSGEIDERITFAGLRLFGGIFHWASPKIKAAKDWIKDKVA